ncbi:MAG: hypothetical protein WD206_10130 [Actinomycetota bacterium]
MIGPPFASLAGVVSVRFAPLIAVFPHANRGVTPWTWAKATPPGPATSPAVVIATINALLVVRIVPPSSPELPGVRT